QMARGARHRRQRGLADGGCTMTVTSFTTGAADKAQTFALSSMGSARVIFRNLSGAPLIFCWSGADAGPSLGVNGIIVHQEGQGSGGVLHLEAGFTSIPVPQFLAFSARGSQGGQALSVEID